MIVGNLVGQPGTGFESDRNAVLLALKNGKFIEVPEAGKRQIADKILDQIPSLRK
jgi:phosphopantothenoylcysteine synthetase/decarboxylase